MVKKITFFCVLLVSAFAGFATNYYSSLSGGNFTDPIWSTDSAGPYNLSGTAILYSDNLVVQGGTVTLDYSVDSLYCKNLTIEKGATVITIHGATFDGDITINKGGILLLGPMGGSTGFVSAKDIFVKYGGKIWSNDPVNDSATNVKAIRIWGSQLVCNGTIGDGANNDALMIEAQGTEVTISGTGKIDVCRLRNSSLSKATTQLTVDADINCRLGTTCIYNFLNKSSFNLTINAGRTVRCIPIANPSIFPGTEGSVSLNGSTGGSSRRRDTYVINGTLECEYLVLKAKTTNALDTFNVIVGGSGVLKVNKQLIGNAGITTNVAANLQLMDSATLQLLGSVPTTGIDATGSSNKFMIAPTATIAYLGDAQTIENGFGNYGNLVIGGTGNKQLLGNTNISSNLTILNGTTLDASGNNYNLNIGGNWIDSTASSQGLTAENGTVNFNGTSPQSIIALGQESFYNLTIGNANGVTAGKNLAVFNNLSLLSGILSLNNGNQLKVYNTASNAISGGSNSAYVDGKLVWSVAQGNNSYSFPVGNAGVYASASVANPSVATDVAVQYFNNGYSNTTATLPFHVSTLEYWQIASSAFSANATITLNYSNGGKSNIVSPSDLVLAGFDGSQWNNLGQVAYTGNSNAGSVTGTATNWGAFTFGSNSALNPLPIKLVSFNGTRTSNGVLLNWNTVSETNTKLFAIEASTNGNQFHKLESINAKQISLGNDYSYLDKTNYGTEKVYYRLKVYDDIGSFKYSNTINVALNTLNQNFQFKYYNNTIHLQFSEVAANNSASIYNAIGQRVYQAKLIDSNPSISTAYLANGVYFLHILSGNQQASYQFKK